MMQVCMQLSIYLSHLSIHPYNYVFNIKGIIAGVACICSALSYAELSNRVPSAGSAYAYSYLGLGEFMAVIAAFCLSLEYGVSGTLRSLKPWNAMVVHS